MVAPLIGGLLGCFFYQVFIQWHLPDIETDEDEGQSQIYESNNSITKHEKDALPLQSS